MMLRQHGATTRPIRRPLLINAAKCANCGTVIMSLTRHDWQACKCFANEEGNKGIYVDGGQDYIRRGGVAFDPAFDEQVQQLNDAYAARLEGTS